MKKIKELHARYNDKDNFGRLISMAKRHFDVWSHQNIKPKKAEMKLSFMPVIFNISPEGNTNTELSKKSMVFKQAMSRTLKELEDIGMITSTPINHDKRSSRIHLTKEGGEFVSASNDKLSGLVDQYIDLVGEKDFKTTLRVLSHIVDFHQNLPAEK
jgi:DNA-binding MarR family transcriptional regulator